MQNKNEINSLSLAIGPYCFVRCVGCYYNFPFKDILEKKEFVSIDALLNFLVFF